MNAGPHFGRRVAAWAAVLALLGAVFAAWMNPHPMVDLANAVWSCF